MSDFLDNWKVDGHIDAVLGFKVNGAATSGKVLVGDGTTFVAGDAPGILPIGGVVAWHKSFTNTPALPAQYVECNGQTLSDAGSVFNGQTIPNLNASGGGTQRFLRGATTSGGTGGSDSHTHAIGTRTACLAAGACSLSDASVTGSTSTLPSYFEIVWVMRVK